MTEYLVHAITKDSRLISFTVSAQNHQVAISRREAIQKVMKEFPDLVTIAYMEKLPDYDIKQGG